MSGNVLLRIDIIIIRCAKGNDHKDSIDVSKIDENRCKQTLASLPLFIRNIESPHYYASLKQ